MKASELIGELQKAIDEYGDLDVWIDSLNEIEFGEVKSVEGKWHYQRPSNHNPHIYIVTDIESVRDCD